MFRSKFSIYWFPKITVLFISPFLQADRYLTTTTNLLKNLLLLCNLKPFQFYLSKSLIWRPQNCDEKIFSLQPRWQDWTELHTGHYWRHTLAYNTPTEPNNRGIHRDARWSQVTGPWKQRVSSHPRQDLLLPRASDCQGCSSGLKLTISR